MSLGSDGVVGAVEVAEAARAAVKARVVVSLVTESREFLEDDEAEVFLIVMGTSREMPDNISRVRLSTTPDSKSFSFKQLTSCVSV